MKKFLTLILTAALLLLPRLAGAAVTVLNDGTPQGAVEKINFTGRSTLDLSNKSITIPIVDTSLIAAGAANGGATSLSTSQLEIPTGYAYIRKALTSNTGYTSSDAMADGKPGELKTIHAVAGSGSFLVSATTATGWATVTLNSVGDMVTFLYLDDTTGWTLLTQQGCVVTVP